MQKDQVQAMATAAYLRDRINAVECGELGKMERKNAQVLEQSEAKQDVVKYFDHVVEGTEKVFNEAGMTPEMRLHLDKMKEKRDELRNRSSKHADKIETITKEALKP